MIKQYRKDGQPRYVGTANVDFLVQARQTKDWPATSLLQVLRTADLVTADGMPLVWLSRLLGCPISHRVAGADLVPHLADLCAERGYRLFLLGGEPAVARAAAEALERRNARLQIVGIATPQVQIDRTQNVEQNAVDEEIIEQIKQTKPDVLLISFGCPKQELWFARVYGRLPVPLSIGVGATFKFLAGMVQRAPFWMRKSGLEWIHRWMQEPQQLSRRYMRDLVVFPYMAWKPIVRLWMNDLSGKAPAADVAHLQQEGEKGEEVLTLILPKAFLQSTCRQLCPKLEESWGQLPLVIDCTHTERVDIAGMGFLLELIRQSDDCGPVCCYGISNPLRNDFLTNGIWDAVKPLVFENREMARSYCRTILATKKKYNLRVGH